MLCACMIFCSVYCLAQNEVRVNEPDLNKPKLFTALPENITVNPERLTELFAATVGNEVNITIGDIMPFQGRVMSVHTENNISSVVVRSTNFSGARLTFTKAVIDGTAHYVARILSLKHGDLYELKAKNGQYAFIKKNYYDLINE